jgi:hypothetical protein
MNLITHMLGKLRSTDDTPFEDLSPEKQERILAEEKAARVKDHRDNVRNGPVRHRYISTGQQRRRVERDKASFDRKLNKRHRRKYMNDRIGTAVLRGQLQALGAAEVHPGTVFTIQQRINAGRWVLERFGAQIPADGTLDEQVLITAVETAKTELRNRLGIKAAA